MVRQIILCLFLAGCSASPIKEPVRIPVQQELVCNVNKPLPINTLRVTIEVIQDADGRWWVALDDESYKNLAINNVEVARYIADLQVYADTLNSCIASTKKES